MIIITIAALLLGGFMDAAMDVLQFSFRHSKFSNWNPQFWDPEVSWRNKYKKSPYNTEAVYVNEPLFFGSTTFLVWLTDGWHLFKFIRNMFIITAVVTFQWNFGHMHLIPVAICFVTAHAIWSGGFTIGYKVL